MTIEERIATLELALVRTRRRALWLLVALIPAIGAIGYFALRGPVLDHKTDRLTLADAESRKRIVLAQSTSGPVLALYEKGGLGVAMMGISMDGPTLLLTDEHQERHIVLVAGESETYLESRHRTGGAAVRLEVADDGPRLTLRDDNGEVLWTAP